MIFGRRQQPGDRERAAALVRGVLIRSPQDPETTVNRLEDAVQSWRRLDPDERAELLRAAGARLREAAT